MIDLRSDTVTRPTPAMRTAMAEAEVGDDVFGDDPTVPKLETLAAEMLGHEAGAFVPSGTQSNLIALLTHCGRGDEYIVGQEAHTYIFEGGGGAALGGLQPQPMTIEPDGTLDLARVEEFIKPDDFHYARTRLLCLENTSWGRDLPFDYLKEARQLADSHGLRMHLDGARIFNAAVKQNRPASEIAQIFDTVSVCLSKGLGAPVGSVLVGNRDFIKEAKRWRKVVGGGMRQAGILAAAGIHALEYHVERLADDHANAQRLQNGLASIDGITFDPKSAQTNMVFPIYPNADEAPNLAEYLEKEHQILVTPYSPMQRLVTHLDVSSDDIDTVVQAVREFFA